MQNEPPSMGTTDAGCSGLRGFEELKGDYGRLDQRHGREEGFETELAQIDVHDADNWNDGRVGQCTHSFHARTHVRNSYVL